MIISHNVGHSISLELPNAAGPLWQFQYGDTPKPHFRSLRTPGGDELALVEPYDHLWHRGLWFTIKFVNGVNFWEERDEFGIQQVVGVPDVTVEDDAVTIRLRLNWAGPAGDIPIVEERTITWRPGDDAYTLDWTSALTAQTDLTLDRTPFTTWGGYSGLSFRGNRTWHIDRYLLPGKEEKPLSPGYRAPWCDLSGQFDGGPGKTGGIAMFDQPDEVGNSTPWYGGGNPAMNFFNAAFLFEGPAQMEEAQTSNFSYRVVVHNGIWSADQAEAAYRQWENAPVDEANVLS
jgi:hypothetical protein